jgi:hypothetical protein
VLSCDAKLFEEFFLYYVYLKCKLKELALNKNAWVVDYETFLDVGFRHSSVPIIDAIDE